MIQQLDNVDSKKPKLYGEKILWLKKLFDADLKIADTIIITNEFFLEFMHEKKLDESKIKDVLHAVKDRLSNPSQLFFKISTCKPNFGLDDNIVANASLKDIKIKLEEIFHSWFSDSSIGYRITHSIEPTDTYPALILQTYHKKVSSLVTRCPQTGLVTDQHNLDNVDNKANIFTTHHLEMLTLQRRFILLRHVEYYYDVLGRGCLADVAWCLL